MYMPEAIREIPEIPITGGENPDKVLALFGGKLRPGK